MGVIALLAFVTLAVAGHASPWVEVEIPEEGQGTYEALHFITADEGWMLSRRQDGAQLRLDTFDGGETWDVQPISEEDYRVLRRARFADPLNGWAHADLSADLWLDREDGHNPGEDNGILAPVLYHRTWDGGRTWALQHGEITEVAYFGDVPKAREADRKYMSATHFVNSEFGVVAGTAGVARAQAHRTFTVFRGHTLLVTRDGGPTWSMHVFGGALPNDRFDPTWGPPPPIVSIAFIGEQYGRIPASGGQLPQLLRTDDAGRTWEAIEGNPRNGAAPTFGDRATFTTPSDGWSWGRIRGMARTADGGRSWSSLEPVLGHAVAFTNATHGWLHAAVADAPGSSRVIRSLTGLYATADGGETWTLEFATVRGGVPIVAYAPPNPAVWMYGHQALFRRPLGVATEVRPRGQLLATWASIKHKNQE